LTKNGAGNERFQAYLHPEVETLAPEDLRKLQEHLWAKQWKYVCKNSAMYQEKLAAWLGIDVSLETLQDLPLTEKDDLRISQETESPLGDYIRIHRTSGTTGRPLILANSRADAEIIAKVGGRSMWAAGLRPNDRVVHCLNYCMWTGGFTDHTTLEATGAAVLPYGIGQTKALIKSIQELGITAISCTPSYPAFLEQVLAESYPGLSPASLGLRLGLFGGEAGLDNVEFRMRMEDRWGFKVRNANFGLSEVLSILGGQSEWSSDLMFHAGDVVFAEILDPATGERLPIAEGTVGELVCTHLVKECQPLIRYRTRDVVTVTGVGPGEDGRTAWRFRVSGRTDDMFNVRGINVFPTAVRVAVEAMPEISSGQFRIVLRGDGPYDRIEVRAEAAEHLPEDQWVQAGKALQLSIQARIGAGAVVEILPFGALPRTDGKTQWVERISK
jgi:phenylacetate-CoA ligase